MGISAMSTMQIHDTGITRDNSSKYDTATGGTPTNALFANDDIAAWKSACDEMLLWRSLSSPFEPEDQPDQAILNTAIDYAVDQIREGGPAPSSIIPSGSGRIAMEWNDAPITVIVEFIDVGTAIHTIFNEQKVVSRGILIRNPKSRKLELRG
jgi:hypothetical protein